jgi:glycosyltransferase involved in cell wall biosynthesis
MWKGPKMSDQNILLSICIPTFNRANYLYSNLLSIFNQVDQNEEVEVIVSDNSSTDATPKIVQEFMSNKNFIYFRQQTNIGFSKNILQLTPMAKGRFCWIVGDDDFILQGAISSVLALIKQNPNIDYFYASIKGIPVDEYKRYSSPFETSKYHTKCLPDEINYQQVAKWEDLLTNKYSIIFLGELMASIFRREIWMSHKIKPKEEDFVTLETTYPHSVILANTFIGKKAIYIKTPLILALDGAREWWGKLGFILIVHVKSLLDLYKEKRVSKKILNQCYISYLRMTMKYVFRYLLHPKAQFRDKVSLRRYSTFAFAHPLFTAIALLANTKEMLASFMKRTRKRLPQ